MIIWLASYPRSGNTYIRVLLNRLYGLQTYSIYNDHRAFSDIVKNLIGGVRLEKDLNSLRKDETYHFVKTHELPRDDRDLTIYLVRDGRDVYVSYAHYILSFEKEEKAVESRMFRQTLHDLIYYDHSFGGWSNHVMQWLNRKPSVIIVKFEDMVCEPIQTVQNVMDKIGFCLNNDSERFLPSFEDLHTQLPQIFRKGKIGNWVHEMPDDLHALFWEKNKSTMDFLGYK